ncbi:MAG: bacillithiol biosynthesis deacetylase BshB1 [Thermonemataceae bacterium]
MKLDILVFAAHPDDAELSCSGTIAAHIAQGKKVGIVDFTAGELGTRGSVAIRQAEAKAASEALGLSVRDNLQLKDGFFENNAEAQLAVIKAIRTYQPEIVLANALEDRHPDHGRGAKLAYEACFLAGLEKIKTQSAQEEPQKAWRPKALFHYIQDLYMTPDFIVDISAFWTHKMAAIKAFRSQFYDPDSKEADTYISSPTFLEALEARAKEMGHAIGVAYGEGFVKRRALGVQSLFDFKTFDQ